MTRLCLLLSMKYLRAITALSLPMVRQGQEKHTRWKEEQEKRFRIFNFYRHLPICSTLNFSTSPAD